MKHSVLRSFRHAALVLFSVLLVSVTNVRAEVGDGAVTISTKFPGGNVAVTQNEGRVVHVAPDLRGDSPWFYWYFQAEVSTPGRVKFVFPDKVAGFVNGGIGMQGPAISADDGRTWKWMGKDNVDGSSFFYNFAQANDRVRFAVTIPYVQTQFDEFLKTNAANPHLKKSVLTKSRHGRDVELLQIGEPGRDKKAVLVTGRHHATEW